MARTVIYECRRCDVRVSEPISSYVDHPNDWVYEAGLCDACSEIAEQDLLSELLNRPSAQQPADLAPDPRDVELAALKRAMSQVRDGLRMVDRGVMEWTDAKRVDLAIDRLDAALQASPERPAASEAITCAGCGAPITVDHIERLAGWETQTYHVECLPPGLGAIRTALVDGDN